MIALENTAKIGKSPKKPRVELKEDNDDDEQESEQYSDEDSIIESEARELESADEGFPEQESDSEDRNNNSEDEESKVSTNPGWADVMQKILKTKKPKHKKTVVLSKAKKLCDVVKKEKEEVLPFEIEKVKEEEESREIQDTKTATEKPVAQTKRRKDHLGIRVKPTIADRERERLLQKIATKGVVQLFNAVRQQQGEISKKLTEAGPLERKRDKVLKSINKRSFLDVLMGESQSMKVDNDVKHEEEGGNDKNKKKKDDQVWNVLREDFVMGAKLKDWDRRSDNDDSSAAEDMDSDE